MKNILVLVLLSPVLGKDEFLRKKDIIPKKDISASVLQQGWADSSQQQMLLRYASDCFSWNPVDTSSGVGTFQGTLGDAISCVLINLEQRWGWKPELKGSGSNNGGPYDAYGAGNTIIGVDTPAGKWQFILQKADNQGGSSGNTETESVSVHCLHRGDATAEQETDLIHFTESCFGKNHIDVANMGSFQSSLSTAIGCVQQKCEEKWGWKPELSNYGSNTGGPYDVHGLGATVIGADTSTGKWSFVLRLKF